MAKLLWPFTPIPKRGIALTAAGNTVDDARRRHTAAQYQPPTQTAMTATQTQGNWNIMKGRLKQKWANLTDDDLLNVEGTVEELVGRIQKRTGEARDEIKRFLNECDCSLD